MKTKTDHQSSRRAFDWLPVWIILLALALRAIYIVQIQDSPYYHYPQIDALWHHLWAQEIASGEIIGKEVFFRAPLYPYFLGAIYAVFGDGPLAPRIIQSLIGTASCLLIFLIARRLFNRKIAALAGLIAAAYPLFIYFDNELLLETLFIFLMLLMFFFALKAKEHLTGRRLFLTGLFCGLSAITRPTILIALPIILYYLFLHDRTGVFNLRRLLIGLLLLLGGMAVAIAPVTIRNYAVGRDFVPIAYQGGVNFWIGNNPQADGKTAAAPGYYKAYQEYQDNVKFSSARIAEERQGRRLKPSEISDYWYGQGLEFIRTKPLAFLGLSLKKLYFTWNAYELEGNRDIYSQRAHSSLFAVLLWHKLIGFPFGLLAPLALAGIIIMLMNFKKNIFLLGFLFSYQLALILYFTTSRLRLPTLPFLIILAAVAIRYFLSAKSSRPALLAPLLATAIGLIVVNTNLFGMKPPNEARNYQSQAEIFIRRGQADSAIVYAQMAIKEQPGDPVSLAFLGTAYELKGDYMKASEAYIKSLALNDRDAFVQNHLGYCLFRLGELEDALEACTKALSIDSTIIEIYTNLGYIYGQMKNTGKALEIYRQGYQIDSTNVGFLNNYAVALRDARLLEEAVAVLRQAAVIDPQYLPARVNLAGFHLEMGKIAEAESLYQEALKLAPNNIQANLNFAQLYIRTGRAEQAIPYLQKILRLQPGHETAQRLLEIATGQIAPQK